MVMKSKEVSQKNNVFAKGGTTKMFGPMGADPMEAGVSAPVRAPGMNKSTAKGGGTGVMGKQGGAMPAGAGQVVTYGSGNNDFKVSGGKGHMASFTPAANAKPA